MRSVGQVHSGPPAQHPHPQHPRPAPCVRDASRRADKIIVSMETVPADANGGGCHGGLHAGSLRASRTAPRRVPDHLQAGTLPLCVYPAARFTVACLLHRRAMRGHRAGV